MCAKFKRLLILWSFCHLYFLFLCVLQSPYIMMLWVVLRVLVNVNDWVCEQLWIGGNIKTVNVQCVINLWWSMYGIFSGDILLFTVVVYHHLHSRIHVSYKPNLSGSCTAFWSVLCTCWSTDWYLQLLLGYFRDLEEATCNLISCLLWCHSLTMVHCG